MSWRNGLYRATVDLLTMEGLNAEDARREAKETIASHVIGKGIDVQPLSHVGMISLGAVCTRDTRTVCYARPQTSRSIGRCQDERPLFTGSHPMRRRRPVHQRKVQQPQAPVVGI